MQEEQRHTAMFVFDFISLAFWLNVCGGVAHFNTDVVFFFFSLSKTSQRRVTGFSLPDEGRTFFFRNAACWLAEKI